MATTMVPPAGDRPDVLPTERLLVSGKCVPELRGGLRRIPDLANAWSVVALWGWVAAMVAAVALAHRWWVTAIAFVLMGPVYVRFAILMHEAAHKLLFSSKRWNDLVGTWLVAYPAFVPIQLYRRAHFAHHKQEFGPGDPDVGYYSGYPSGYRALARRLSRDAVGISGWKNLVPLVKATVHRTSEDVRRVARSIVGVQLLLWAVSWAATGRWWIYPLLWLAPWMTQWRVLNRLRSIAEHGGLQASDDRRATTHHVRQSLLARFWLVPYNTGWHLAHHVDMGVPWRHLPAFHRELEAAGYVTPGITYPSYPALWRALATGRTQSERVRGVAPSAA